MSHQAFDDELVSIITPAYRAGAYVGETIQSVLAQSYPHWEMLIADDCSPDDTRAVVQAWCERDPRVRLIALAKNGGPAAARNAALAQAKGRWLAFLDSDDLWLPQKLEHTLAHARATQAALVFTGFRRISFDGQTTGRAISVPDALTYSALLGNTAIATSTVLIDRAQTGDIHMQSVFYDDFVCWLGILKRGLAARGLNEDLMRYRVVAQSVSRNKRRSAAEVWKTYRQVEQLGLLRSGWHFAHYAVNAALKYRQF